jgi:hypothetical protein
MLGYLANVRIGSAVYNFAHTCITPAILLAIAYLAVRPQLFPIALIWTAHIGFDRLLGFGLKYPGNCCVDAKLSRLVAAFRGTEYFKDWLDDFDFAPAPYSAIPGRGTVHQGFQIVYQAVRDNLRKLVQCKAPNCKQLLITGHSLGGALAALSAPDLLNDVAANLAPIVYTWAEPRVGHPDFVRLFDTRVNICFRIVNLSDVVPHLPA